MAIKIIGTVIGALILGAGIYCLVKKKVTENLARFTVSSAVSAV